MTFRPGESTAELVPLGETDSLTPFEFYATFKRTTYGDAERRLMAAILEDAVACLTFNRPRYSRRQQKEFAAAHAWVNEQEDIDWVFSFINICETLGMDPGYLRKGLNEWSALSHNAILESQRGCSRKASGLRHKQVRFRAIY